MIRRSKKARQRARMVKELDEAARLAVFERDEHLCVRCRIPGRAVQWSHVIGRRHKNIRWEADNALTLCAGCHMWWHEYPTLSGEWFRKNWPDRYERIHKMFNAGGKVTMKDLAAMLMTLVVLCCFSLAADLPDSPSATKKSTWHEIEDSRPLPHRYCDGPRFFQFRKGPNDQPTSNKQVFKSKAFWIQSGFMFAAEELARTRTRSESEPWAAGAVMGFSYLGYRFFSPSFTLGEDGAAISWLNEWRKAR